MSIDIVSAVQLRTEKYRTVFVMVEERLGHYAGFREALIDAFKLTPADAVGGSPGYFRAGTGREYQLVCLSPS